ncbi:MAG: hypothetical protein U5J95_04845 [Balneolaceae bacterium]|nr:hypothetical protein [Balneolaceae bacterium]
MKKTSGRLLLLAVFLFAAQTGYSQAEIGQTKRQLKDVSQARSIAFNNTVTPILLGFAANYLLDNNTFETAGAYLVIYGIVAGPSGGNFYAEDYLRGGLGVLARMGTGYFLMTDATREILGKDVSRSLDWDDKKVSIEDPEVLIGAGVILGTMVYNYISAKASVNEHNSALGYNVRLNPNIRQEQGRFVPMISATINF